MSSTPELVKRRFAEELRRCCGSYYPTTPSHEQFARDLYASSTYALKVSRETVRKWFKGASFPDLDHLLHLIAWLGLDTQNIFRPEDPRLALLANLHGVEVQHPEDSTTLTPDQIDALLDVLTKLKNAN